MNTEFKIAGERECFTECVCRNCARELCEKACRICVGQKKPAPCTYCPDYIDREEGEA